MEMMLGMRAGMIEKYFHTKGCATFGEGTGDANEQ